MHKHNYHNKILITAAYNLFNNSVHKIAAKLNLSMIKVSGKSRACI